MRRFIAAVSYLICSLVGTVLGFFIGKIFSSIALRLFFILPIELSGNASLGEPTLDQFVDSALSFGGALYVAARFIAAHERYYRLVELRRTHRMTFYALSSHSHVPENIFVDILWAFTYVFLETVLPLIAGVAVFCLVGWLFFGQIGYWFLLLGAIAWWYAACVAGKFVEMLFSLQRLERELKESPLIFNVLRVEEDERKKG